MIFIKQWSHSKLRNKTSVTYHIAVHESTSLNDESEAKKSVVTGRS